MDDDDNRSDFGKEERAADELPDEVHVSEYIQCIRQQVNQLLKEYEDKVIEIEQDNYIFRSYSAMMEFLDDYDDYENANEKTIIDEKMNEIAPDNDPADMNVQNGQSGQSKPRKKNKTNKGKHNK